MKELYQGLGHIAIHTRDMAESIAFYEKIGGTLRQRDAIPTPDGDKLLALVEFGGFVLELIQSPTPRTHMPSHRSQAAGEYHPDARYPHP